MASLEDILKMYGDGKKDESQGEEQKEAKKSVDEILGMYGGGNKPSVSKTATVSKPQAANGNVRDTMLKMLDEQFNHGRDSTAGAENTATESTTLDNLAPWTRGKYDYVPDEQGRPAAANIPAEVQSDAELADSIFGGGTTPQSPAATAPLAQGSQEADTGMRGAGLRKTQPDVNTGLNRGRLNNALDWKSGKAATAAAQEEEAAATVPAAQGSAESAPEAQKTASTVEDISKTVASLEQQVSGLKQMKKQAAARDDTYHLALYGEYLKVVEEQLAQAKEQLTQAKSETAATKELNPLEADKYAVTNAEDAYRAAQVAYAEIPSDENMAAVYEAERALAEAKSKWKADQEEHTLSDEDRTTLQQQAAMLQNQLIGMEFNNSGTKEERQALAAQLEAIQQQLDNDSITRETNVWKLIKGIDKKAGTSVALDFYGKADSLGLTGMFHELWQLVGTTINDFGGNVDLEVDPIMKRRASLKAGLEQITQESTENARTKLAQFADKYGTQVWQQAPTMLLSLMSWVFAAPVEAAMTTEQLANIATKAMTDSRVLALAQNASSGLSQMVKDPQWWYSFTVEGGSAYNEAIDDGASPEQAAMASIIYSFLAATVETGGADEALGGIQSKSFIESLGNGEMVEYAQLISKSVLGEVLEEEEQNTLQMLTRQFYTDINLYSDDNITIDSNFNVTKTDPLMGADSQALINPATMLETAKDTAITTLLMGGGEKIISAAIDTAFGLTSKNTVKANDVAAFVKGEASLSQVITEEAREELAKQGITTDEQIDIVGEKLLEKLESDLETQGNTPAAEENDAPAQTPGEVFAEERQVESESTPSVSEADSSPRPGAAVEATPQSAEPTAPLAQGSRDTSSVAEATASPQGEAFEAEMPEAPTELPTVERTADLSQMGVEELDFKLQDELGPNGGTIGEYQIQFIPNGTGYSSVFVVDSRTGKPYTKSVKNSMRTKAAADLIYNNERSLEKYGDKVHSGNRGRTASESGQGRTEAVQRNAAAQSQYDIAKRRQDRAKERAENGTDYASKTARELAGPDGLESTENRVIPEEDYDDELRAIDEDIFNKTKKHPTFVLGQIQIDCGDGVIAYISGLHSSSGIVVMADSRDKSAKQLADHEYFHELAEKGKVDVSDMLDELVGDTISQEELDALRQIYEDHYGQIYGYSEKASALAMEELCADLYAGISGRKGAKITDAAMTAAKDYVSGTGKYGSSQQAQNVQEDTGPPAESETELKPVGMDRLNKSEAEGEQVNLLDMVPNKLKPVGLERINTTEEADDESVDLKKLAHDNELNRLENDPGEYAKRLFGQQYGGINEQAQAFLDEQMPNYMQLARNGAPIGPLMTRFERDYKKAYPNQSMFGETTERELKPVGLERLNKSEPGDKPVDIRRMAQRMPAGAVLGKEGTTYTNDNTAVKFNYAVYPADTLVASTDINGNINEAYPQEFQPRDRSRAFSQIQMAKISKTLNPERLGASAEAQTGAPIVRSDGVVIGGNGRTVGIQTAYSKGRAGEYSAYIKEHAAEFGIDPKSIPENPVLVRVTESKNYAQLAKDLNAQTTQAMSATEQAESDADIIRNISSLYKTDENGKLSIKNNRDFIAAFTKGIPETERNTMTTADGQKLSATGRTRIVNALFQAAYGDPDLTAALAEDEDSNGRNIINGLRDAAPSVIDLNAAMDAGNLYSADISKWISEAVEIYQNAKGNGLTLGSSAGQISMDSDEGPGKAIAVFFEKNARSAKQIREYVNALGEALEAYGKPITSAEDSLFGGTEDVQITVSDLFNRAAEIYGENTGNAVGFAADDFIGDAAGEALTVKEAQQGRKVSGDSKLDTQSVRGRGRVNEKYSLDTAPKVREDWNDVQRKTFAANNANTEVGSTLYTLNPNKGTAIKRFKNTVGKEVSGQIYLHADYVEDLLDNGIPADVYDNAVQTLADKHPGFEYTTIMYDKNKGSVRFDEAPDFDTAREPIAGNYITVNPDGTTSEGYSDYIWHHKWLWVQNNYKGFDVADSWNWSKQWLNTIYNDGTKVANRGIANGTGHGTKNWNAQLEHFGLPTDKKQNMFSLDAVEPAEPKTEKWQSGHSEAWFLHPDVKISDEIKAFPVREDVSQAWLEARKAKGWTEGHKSLKEKGLDSKSLKVGTQIESTRSTYEKIFNGLKALHPDTWQNMRVLDASSGLGLGTKAGIEMGFDVTDIEPYVHPDSAYMPDYMDYSSLQKLVQSGKVKPFDFIISNAVLNVIPQDTRDNMVAWFGSVLAPGGQLYVNTLDASYTKNAKAEIEYDSKGRPKGQFLTQKGENGAGNEVFVWGSQSVQKGFSGAELRNYLQDALGDGFTVSNTKLASGSGATALVTKKGDNAKFSLDEVEEAKDGLIAVQNSYSGNISPESGSIRFSLEEAQTIEDRSMAYYEAHPAAHISSRMLDDANKVTANLVEHMKPFLNVMNNKGKRYLPEEILGKTTFSNGSYDKTIENTTICFRTLSYIDFTNEIKEQLGRPLTVEESFLASQMLYDIAKEPQCLYCYVSLDRKAYDGFLLNYTQQRDAAMEAYRWADIDPDERLKPQAKRKSDRKSAKYALGDSVLENIYRDYLDGREDTPNQRERFNMWIEAEQSGEVIGNEDLTTEEKRSKIKNEDSIRAKQIKDAEAYAQGASWAKKLEQYRAYNSDILSMSPQTVKKLNAHYGLRFYSFSEYTAAFIAENMQQIRDAAIKGLYGLAYTKKTDFARIFGKTGMNINISCFGRMDGGEVVADTLQGADWNEVRELREKYPNVGAVFVATNDEMVEWALAQDWIDVVIPFHIVRTGANVAEFYKWVNNTKDQADVDANGRNKTISPAEFHNDRETYFKLIQQRGLTPRFAKWAENPNYMKLVNETRQSDRESGPLKPIYDEDAAIASFDQFVEEGGYYGDWYEEGKDYDAAVKQVVNDIKAGKRANEVDYGRQDFDKSIAMKNRAKTANRQHMQKFSLDEEYESLAENPDENRAALQKMVKQAASKAGYTPVVRYHQTAASFTKFNTNNAKAGLHDSETPNGIFFKTNDHDIGIGGDIQMQAYLKHDNLLRFKNREEANKWYCKNVPGYAELQDEMKTKTKKLDDQMNSLEDRYFNNSEMSEEEFDSEWNTMLNRLTKVENKYRDQLRGMLNEYFLDGASEYDGIELEYDGHRYVKGKRENVHTFIVFDSSQVKSADPVTYDDSGNVIPLSERFNDKSNDIRYSLDEVSESTEDKPGANLDWWENYRQSFIKQNDRDEFRGTANLAQLGINIAGNEGIYDRIESLKNSIKALRSVKAATTAAEKRVKASYAETTFAKGIASGIYTEADIPSTFNVNKVTELADFYFAEQGASDKLMKKQKALVNKKLDQKMYLLMGEGKVKNLPKSYKLNFRTPLRSMREIFGDKAGQEIYNTIFAPVEANTAERDRFRQRMYNAVEKFTGEDGKQSKLSKQESALVMAMVENEQAAILVKEMETGTAVDKRQATAIRDAVKNIQNGQSIGDALKEWKTDEKTKRTVNQLVKWEEAQKLIKDQKLDTVKLENAAKTYQAQFASFYDAINDLLAAHGYEPIGFIKGYAPHMQEEHVQTALQKAMEFFGITEDVTNLPTEIAGMTANFRPNKRWNPYFLQRNGEAAKQDIVAAYESYVDYMSDVIYHMDDIMRVRAFERYFRETYSDDNVRDRIEEAKTAAEGTLENKTRFLRDLDKIGPEAVLDEQAADDMIENYIKEMYQQFKQHSVHGPLVTWLTDYANNLAAKQLSFDRGGETFLGRKYLNVSNKLTQAFATSQVGGKLSSVLNQGAQLPMIYAELGGKYTARAMKDFMFGRLKSGGWSAQSDFLVTKMGVDSINPTLADMVVDKMFIGAEFVDSMMSTLAVRGRYLKGLDEGLSHKDAMKAADRFGSDIMGSRAKGTKPLAFASKDPIKRMLTMFQIEALNSWDHVISDLPHDFREIEEKHGRAKAASALAGVILKSLIASFLMNRLDDEIYGGTPAPFDLLGLSANFVASGNGLRTNDLMAIMVNNMWKRATGEELFEGIDDSKMSDGKFNTTAAFKELGENVVNDVPLVRNIASLLGWGDSTLPFAGSGVNALVDKLMGEKDGKSWAETLRAFALGYVPGGSQIERTIQGAEALREGGVYSSSGKLKYALDNQDPLTIARVLAFGKYANPEAQRYYADIDFSGKTGNALSETQQKAYNLATEAGMRNTNAEQMIRSVWSSAKELSVDKDGKQASTINQTGATAALDAMDIPKELKAVLWQCFNKTWKGTNNPYSTKIGTQVYEAFQAGETPDLSGLSLPGLD